MYSKLRPVCLVMLRVFSLVCSSLIRALLGRHGNEQIDIQHNYTQHNDTQHNNKTLHHSMLSFVIKPNVYRERR